jgi:hypothetical protein
MAASVTEPLGRAGVGQGPSGRLWFSTPQADFRDALRDTLSWGRVRSRRFTLDTRLGYSLILDTEGELPDWFEPVVDRLAQLLRLPANWDSHGARSVAPQAVIAVVRALLETMPEDVTGPSIVPTVDGGVQLEWHSRGIDLEVGVLPSAHYSVSFEDHQRGEAWEREAGWSLAPMREALLKLSQR